MVDNDTLLDSLRLQFLPGSEIYSVCVNKGSRAKRQYMFLTIENGRIQDVTWAIARVCGRKRTKYGNIVCDDHDLIAYFSLQLGYSASALKVDRKG
jgi:hypothetical protein